MKKIVFLLVMVFSLVGCSSVIERWNPHTVFKEDFQRLSSDLDSLTDNKYNLRDKVEKNF